MLLTKVMSKMGNEPAAAEQDNAFIQKISENIQRQLNNGKIQESDVKDVDKLLHAASTDESPNPIDSALSKISGLSIVGTFDGIDVSEISAVEGLGEVLKDGVVTLMLLDDQRKADEDGRAARKFGLGKRDRHEELKELQAFLEIRKQETQQEEGQFDEKRGAGEKLKMEFEKMKSKAKP